MKLIPRRGHGALSAFRTELDKLFERFPFEEWSARMPALFERGLEPPMNIAETEKSWTVSVELPGFSEKDVQVEVMGKQLVIKGERKWEEEKKNKEYHRVESAYGAFERTVALPENVRLDPDAISASYKRGVLEIVVPKIEPTPSAKIPIKAS